MRTLAFVYIFLCAHLAMAQARKFTPEKLQEIRADLKKAKHDSTRIVKSLLLAEHHTTLPYSEADLDTALRYAQLTIALCKKTSSKYLGFGYMYHAISLRAMKKGGEGRPFMDKAIATFRKYDQKLTLLAALVDIGYWWTEGYDNHMSYLDSAVLLSRKWGLKKAEQFALILQAENHDNRHNIQAALDSRLKALALSENSGIPFTPEDYSKLGYNYATMGQYELGVKYGLLSIKLSEEQHDTTFRMANRYNLLGTTYYNLRQFDEGLACFKKGLAIAEKNHNQLNFYTMVNNIAVVLMQIKRDEEAQQHLDHYCSRYPPTSAQDLVLMHNSYTKVYTKLKDHKKAKYHCEQLLENYEKATTKPAVLNTVVEYYLLAKQYDIAESYLNEQEAFYKKNKMIRELTNAITLRFKVDSLRGDYLAAIRDYQQFKKFNDSVFNERRMKQVHDLEIQYETEKKEQSINALKQQAQLQKILSEKQDRDLKLREQDILLLQRDQELQKSLAKTKDQELDLLNQKQQLQIAEAEKNEQNLLLLTQQTALQKSQLQTSNLTRNITGAGLLFTATVIGLLFYAYRNKQRSNREINIKNQSLQNLVQQKEWLMKEIHHRVKNNLQTVVSLLESQSAFIKNREALSAIQDSQNRVNAMSLIHQKLYRTDNMTSIDLSVYVPELIRHLRETLGQHTPIQFKIDIAPLDLDVSQAIPIGLIINEAVTNAIKYAFPKSARSNTISVAMACNDGQIKLIIKDNGIGLPPDFDINSKSGLGLKLMKGLSEDIEGNLSFTTDDGVTIAIYFTAAQILKPSEI